MLFLLFYSIIKIALVSASTNVINNLTLELTKIIYFFQYKCEFFSQNFKRFSLISIYPNYLIYN